MDRKRKRSKKVYLDPEVIDRGVRYSRLHNMSFSQLVSDLLDSLPLPTDLVSGDLSADDLKAEMRRDTITRDTLAGMDEAMRNFAQGNVGDEFDLDEIKGEE